LRGRPSPIVTTPRARRLIINQAMANNSAERRSAYDRILIGKGIMSELEPKCAKIIGIAGDIRDGALNRDPRPAMYIPYAQTTDGTTIERSSHPLAWVIRTRAAPMSAAAQNSGAAPPGDGLRLPSRTMEGSDFSLDVSPAFQHAADVRVCRSGPACSPSSACTGLEWPTPSTAEPRKSEFVWRLAPETGDVQRMVLFRECARSSGRGRRHRERLSDWHGC